MTWLDDDELIEHLQSGDPEKIAIAFEAAETRWNGGDVLTGWVPTPHNLTAYAQAASYEQADFITSFLLGREGFFCEPDCHYTPIIGALVAQSFPFNTVHAVAMRLKIHPESSSHILQVLVSIQPYLGDLPTSRARPIEHFVSCLLEGEAHIVQATEQGLALWTDAQRSAIGLA